MGVGRWWASLPGAIFLLLLLVGPARADGTDSRNAEFLAMLRDDLAPAFRGAASPAARTANIRRLIDERFDVDRIAAVTLGDHWTAAGPDERAGFRAALADHMVRMMSRMLGSGTVEVESAERARDAASGVRYASLMLRTPNGRLPCVFVLSDSGAEERISDVIIYGISLVTVKQAEFRSIFDREGFSGLIAALAQ